MKKRSVLFVCTGNICRSPTAEGVLRHLAEQEGIELRIASAGRDAGCRLRNRIASSPMKRGAVMAHGRPRNSSCWEYVG